MKKTIFKVRPQYHIVLIYLIFGFAWIYLSDYLLEISITSKEALSSAQSIKGWAFICITSFMLFVLIRRAIFEKEKVNLELVAGYEQTIEGWVHVMDLRHKETKDHTERVTAMTLALARKVGIKDTNRLKVIERGAIMHDIGKIGIPDEILIKPAKLTAEEWAQMQQHPIIAHQVLSNITFMLPSIDIPYCHHERLDGTGYPQGLSGEDIPIAARIFAIIDVWDALSNQRVYKKAWAENEVIEHITAQAGHHFDPHICKIFINNYQQIKRAALS